MYKIGVMGNGFVGGAVAAGFSLRADVKIYDSDPEKSSDSIIDVCKQDIIFLCVPTPMRVDNGYPELTFINTAIESLIKNMTLKQLNEGKIVVVKSTVLPGTTRKFQHKYPQFNFITNPEFLTARAARLDFINPARIVLGGSKLEPMQTMIALYREMTKHTPFFCGPWEYAELIKYMSNCFFALKVSYLNEVFDICSELKIDFKEVKEAWLADGRIGNSHHDVPGHDGDRGYGGACFPKDMKAFIQYARSIQKPMLTLEAAVEVNERVRTNKNWEVFDDKK